MIFGQYLGKVAQCHECHFYNAILAMPFYDSELLSSIRRMFNFFAVGRNIMADHADLRYLRT